MLLIRRHRLLVPSGSGEGGRGEHQRCLFASCISSCWQGLAHGLYEICSGRVGNGMKMKGLHFRRGIAVLVGRSSAVISHVCAARTTSALTLTRRAERSRGGLRGELVAGGRWEAAEGLQLSESLCSEENAESRSSGVRRRRRREGQVGDVSSFKARMRWQTGSALGLRWNPGGVMRF